MRRFLAAVVMVLAAATVFALPLQAVIGPGRTIPGPQGGGACGCPKYYRCCLDCSGNFICARTPAQCPECPAP